MTPQTIIDAVCLAYSLTPKDLRRHTRKLYICFPRMVVMYLCRTLLPFPTNSAHVIGRVVGCGHYNVYHGIRSIQDLIDTNDPKSLLVLKLKTQLTQHDSP